MVSECSKLRSLLPQASLGSAHGPVVRFRLLPTPSLDGAVSFSYEQPVFCPMGTSTPLLVRTFRRIR
jgi:hypothetical protein